MIIENAKRNNEIYVILYVNGKKIPIKQALVGIYLIFTQHLVGFN